MRPSTSRLLFVVPLACLLLLGACADASAAERLRLHGSNLLGERLAPRLVRAWLRDIGYAGIRQREVGATRTEIAASRDGEPLVVEIDKRGTAGGFADLVRGDAEICLSSRPPNAAEVDAAWQLGDLRSPAQEWVVGLHGIAVLVAPGNRIAALDLGQLRGIAGGRIRDWGAIGGSPGAIRVHALRAASGTQELVSQLLLAGARPYVDATHSTYAQVVAAVAADPGAIGFVSLKAPRAGLRALAVRSGATAYAPDALAIASEDYPLARRAYLHTGQLITALGRGFAQWVVSPAGQAVVDGSQFVSLSVRPLPAPRRAAGPEDYRRFVNDLQRLPVTVRFSREGLDLLDSRGRQDIDRLAAFLHRPENRARRVLLMAFANPEPGSPYRSLSLSQERADYVSSELLAAEMKVVSVRGFGGQLALADRALPGARWRNERVEVWLK